MSRKTRPEHNIVRRRKRAYQPQDGDTRCAMTVELESQQMRTFSFPYSPLVLAALITAVSLSQAFADAVEVIDPITGTTIGIFEIDFDALTNEQRADVGDQLVEQGIHPRGDGAAGPDLSDVEVTDPTTGETVSLVDIDVASLSDEYRSDIGDQLADLGIEGGHNDHTGEGDANTGRGGADQGHGGPRD